MALLTTKQAAEKLGISMPRIHQLISEGRLPAEKIGRDYLIQEGDLKMVEERKTGRPPKPKEEKSSVKESKKGRKK